MTQDSFACIKNGNMVFAIICQLSPIRSLIIFQFDLFYFLPLFKQLFPIYYNEDMDFLVFRAGLDISACDLRSK